MGENERASTISLQTAPKICVELEEKLVNTIQVLLAVRSPLHRKVLKDLIRREPDIEVVGEVADPVDLLLAVDQLRADVVIQTWPKWQEMPGICTHLLMEYPELLVIGLPPSADRAVKCRQAIITSELPTVGLDELLAEIRMTFTGTQKSKAEACYGARNSTSGG